MSRPKRKRFTRAEMQAEIEELSLALHNQQCRGDTYAQKLSGLEGELEREKRLRRAAEDSATDALRAQRNAEKRLVALLDLHLGLADLASAEQAAYGGARGGGGRG